MSRPCKCGCGAQVRHDYARGHRPKLSCVRCRAEFSPRTGDHGGMCTQCRANVRRGGPVEIDGKLASSRKMQSLAPEGRRWCAGCEKYRSEKFFPRRSGGGFYGRCRACRKVQRQANHVVNTYSITPERYAAIKAAQGGRCAICQIATGASKALAVDHDHSCCPGPKSCGRCVRGTLCSKCNQMLGFARDDPAFFERAAAYLRNPPAKGVTDG